MTVIGFDWDGTLVESFGSTPLPSARERLAELPKGTKTFIATNQAGPVWRVMTGETKYPTCEDVAGQIADGLRALAWWPDLLIICTAPPVEYQHDKRWYAAAYGMALSFPAIRRGLYTVFRDDADERKPAPGMLFRAARHFGAPIDCYIGDMDTDRQAAVAAGCRYLDAVVWRERGLEL